MSDDVWKAAEPAKPAAPILSGPPSKKEPGLNAEGLPKVFDLFTIALEDLFKHFVGYLLVGLPLAIISVVFGVVMAWACSRR